MDTVDKCAPRSCKDRLAPGHWGTVVMASLTAATALVGSQQLAEALSIQGVEILSARWERHHNDAKEWTAFAFEKIETTGKDLLSTTPEDFLDFCPVANIGDEGMKNFYVYLLSSVAELESNFVPTRHYRESFKDSHGEYVISRGLLQLSFESGNGYGCRFHSATDLHDPEQNLSCGIRILNQWVHRDRRIAGRVDKKWRGGARYWSVLRESDKVEQIKKWTSTYCARNF